MVACITHALVPAGQAVMRQVLFQAAPTTELALFQRDLAEGPFA